MSDVSDHEGKWNIAQLFVWVMARDEELVIKYADMPEAGNDRLLRQKTGNPPSGSILSMLSGSKLEYDYFRASRFILRALAGDRLRAWGINNDTFEPEKVPAGDWSGLDFGSDESEEYALSKEPGSGGAIIWRRLQFSRNQSLDLWPKSSRSFKYWDEAEEFGSHMMAFTQSMLPNSKSIRAGLFPTEAQRAARKKRWERTVRQHSDLDLACPLLPDGLPDDPDTTATETLTWMVLGNAITHLTFSLSATCEQRLMAYGAARQQYARKFLEFWDARRGFLVELLDPDRGPDAFIFSERSIGVEVSARSHVEATESGDKALKEYSNSAAADALLFGAIADTSGIQDRSSAWNWLIDRFREAERLLFRLVREEALTMRGRKTKTATEWEIIPPDHLRFPVKTDVSRNALVPSDGKLVDHACSFGDGIAEWSDLLFSTTEVRALSGRLRPVHEYTESAQSAHKAKRGTSASANQCTAWLSELMKLNEYPTDSKEKLRQQAEMKFNTSRRGFETAWRISTANSPNKSWSKPGRRKSNRRIDTPD